MTYVDNFVAEVKCNGKILRIKDGAVHLPYGSEYTLLLKNLNSRKASVKIHIDGQDVLDYSSLILEPNSSTELEGFLSGTVAKNKFKFIQKTKEIQDHRGDRADDGMIRVEFAFEKAKPEVIKKTIITEHHDHCHDHHHHHHYDYYHWWPRFTDFNSGVYYTSNSNGLMNSNVTMTSGGGGTQSDASPRGISNKLGDVQSCYNVNVDSLGIESLGQPLDDEGITVKGSECYQSFRYGSIGELEQSKVIIIQLKGISGSGVQVQQPLTISTKLECPTCGIKSKSSFKFCPSCGTYLE